MTTTDLLLARANPHTFLDPAGVEDRYDFNRDHLVDTTDVLLARNNQTNFLTSLKLLDLTDPGEVLASPAVVDGFVYIRTSEALYAFAVMP